VVGIGDNTFLAGDIYIVLDKKSMTFAWFAHLKDTAGPMHGSHFKDTDV